MRPVAEIWRQVGPNQRVAIVAMTAEAVQGSRERCLEAGMDAFTTKPVKQVDFVQALERWLPIALKSAFFRARRRQTNRYHSLPGVSRGPYEHMRAIRVFSILLCTPPGLNNRKVPQNAAGEAPVKQHYRPISTARILAGVYFGQGKQMI